MKARPFGCRCDVVGAWCDVHGVWSDAVPARVVLELEHATARQWLRWLVAWSSIRAVGVFGDELRAALERGLAATGESVPADVALELEAMRLDLEGWGRAKTWARAQWGRDGNAWRDGNGACCVGVCLAAAPEVRGIGETWAAAVSSGVEWCNEQTGA